MKKNPRSLIECLTSTSHEEKPTVWRKALWCHQPFQDNYTDAKFLECLVVNSNIVQRSYSQVVLAALSIDQQVCIAAIVASVAFDLYEGKLQARDLLACETAAVLLVFFLQTSLKAEPLESSRPEPWFRAVLSTSQQVFQSIILLLLIAILSPLYGTLTASISSDTIVSCACFLLLCHMYLHDYRWPDSRYGSVKGSLGLATAMCSSVLMASQLKNLYDVYALMILSLEGYILAPQLLHYAAREMPRLHMASVAAVTIVTIALISRQSAVLTSALICTLAFITFLCPMWLIRIQKFKAKINGPWDEAAPKLSSTLTHVQQHSSRDSHFSSCEDKIK